MAADKKIEKYRNVTREISLEFRRDDEFKLLEPEKAFVRWYIKAKYGSDGTAIISDGKKDGGIDALIENNKEIFVFQSKYETSLKVSLITRDEYAAFRELARMFLGKNTASEFQHWLGTIRTELIPHYQHIFDLCQNKSKPVKFIFFTTKRNNFGDNEYFEVDDIQNISSLWYLYAEGFTPPVGKIEISFDKVWFSESENGGYKTYIGLADLKQFRRLMNIDINDRLFAQNVRTDLHTKVNESIRKTYESEPDIFWLCNNGIYIVCSKVISHGNDFTLTFPSIINGSQTLHSVKKSTINHSCNIIVRILEMDLENNPTLLNHVIRRTNTQNTMKVINLYAFEHNQLCIALFLEKFHIFYERREKEWGNERKLVLPEYIPVRIKDLAQWLSIRDETIGIGTARNKVSALFDYPNYDKIFLGFDKDFNTEIYKELLDLVWIGLLVDNLSKHLPVRQKSFATIARLFLVKTIFVSVKNSTELHEKISIALSDHRFGKRHLPDNIKSMFSDIIKNIDTYQKNIIKDFPNKDLSNLFKDDKLITSLFSTICDEKEVDKISQVILSNIDRIK